MVEIFKKILLFVVLFIILSYLINTVLIYSLQNSDNYDFKKFQDIKKNSNYYSLLVLGSSKARNHYNNLILDSSLNVKTYCIGSIASFLDVNKMMFDYYLKNNEPPKIMILDLSIYSFQYLEKLPFIAQYMGNLNDEIIYNFIKNNDSKVWFYKYIPLCGLVVNRYALRASLESVNKVFKKAETEVNSGFIPLDGDFYGKRYKDYVDYIEKGPELIKIDNRKVNNLIEIIKICKEKKINLYLVFSPVYSGFFNNINNKDFIMQAFKKISEENNIHFLDYSESSFCSDRKYFFDLDHLNRYGADEFTRSLVKDLLKNNN